MCHFQLTISKDPSIKKWRIGWRFNMPDAPQYEVISEKVGASEAYPGINRTKTSSFYLIHKRLFWFSGLGISAAMTGNDFDIKFLTGIKSFNVKGIDQ